MIVYCMLAGACILFIGYLTGYPTQCLNSPITLDQGNPQGGFS